MQAMAKLTYGVLWDRLVKSFPSWNPDTGAAAAYKRTLDSVHPEDLDIAIDNVCRQERKFPPSAGEVLAAAQPYMRKRRQLYEAAQAKLTQDEVNRRYVNPAPSGVEAMRAYISEGATPFERLARMWECESKAKKIVPFQPTPDAIAAVRWRDFWAMWGKYESTL